MIGILLFIVVFIASFVTKVPVMMIVGSAILALLDVALIIISHSGGGKK